jgi:hypothetical protein
MLNASTVSIVLMIGSLIIALLAIHYLLRTGKRQDPMCALGLLAIMIGLQLAARAAEASGSLWQVTAPGVILFLFGVLVWREGFRRFRNTG